MNIDKLLYDISKYYCIPNTLYFVRREMEVAGRDHKVGIHCGRTGSKC